MGHFKDTVYWDETTSNKKHEMYFDENYGWKRSTQYYHEGIIKQYEWFNDESPQETGNIVYCEYDERERSIKAKEDTGDYEAFSEYYGDTNQAKLVSKYDSENKFIKSNIYDENGNIIQEVSAIRTYYMEYYYGEEGKLIRYDKCHDSGMYEIFSAGESSAIGTDDILLATYSPKEAEFIHGESDGIFQQTEENLLSLTTTEGDVITYRDGKIISVEKNDETILEQIRLDSEGNIKDAIIKHCDGFLYVIYNGYFIQAILPDGTITRYRDGEKRTEISSIIGLTRYYYETDEEGKTFSVTTLNDKAKCLYDLTGKPVRFEKANGDISEFDTEGCLKKLIKANGNEYIYETINSGERTLSYLYITSEGSIAYDENIELSAGNGLVPVKIVYSDTDEYSLVYMSDGTVLKNKDDVISINESHMSNIFVDMNNIMLEKDSVQMFYSTDGNLANIITEDDVNVTFADNGEVVSIESPEGIEYFFADKKLSHLINEDGAEFEFDENEKITRATYPDGRVYSYTYDFDDEGAQLAYVYDSSMGTTRLYKDEIMVWQKTERGVISEYAYDEFDPEVLKKVTQTKNGNIINVFLYRKEDEKTIVTDMEGNVRTYDAEGMIEKLSDIMGNVFNYFHTETGTLVAELAELHKTDGRIIYYADGAVKRVECPNGTVMRDVGFDKYGKLEKFTVTLPNGDTRECSVDGEWTEIVTDDKTKLIYKEYRLVAVNTKGRLLRLQSDELPESIIVDEKETLKIEFDAISDFNNWKRQEHVSSLAFSGVRYDCSNDQLVINAELDGMEASHRQGEIFLDLQYDTPGIEGPLSLRDRKISFLIKLPEDVLLEGNPLIAQVLAKDKNWKTQYGTEVTITKSNAWYKVSLSISDKSCPWGTMDSGFNPDSIRLIGLRVKTPYYNNSVYNGEILIKDGNYFTLPKEESYIDTPFLVDKDAVKPYVGTISGEQPDPGNPNYISWDAIRTYVAADEISEDMGILDLEEGTWRPQDIYYSLGIESINRNDANRESSVTAKLKSGDLQYNDGEMFLDFRYDIPGYNYAGPLNLTGKELNFSVKIPEEFISFTGEPCWAQIFVKDEEYDYQYGTSVFLDSADIWHTLTLTPNNGYVYNGKTSSDFDPSRIVSIGIKISCGKNSDIDREGQFYVKCHTPPETFNENSPKLQIDVNGLKQYAIDNDIVLTFEEELGPEIKLAKNHLPGYFKDDSWAMITEYYGDGSIKSVLKGNDRIENYDCSGLLQNICDKDANILVDYIYNENQELISIDYKKMREDLAKTISDTRNETKQNIVDALQELAGQKQLATDSIDREINSARNQAIANIENLQRQWHDLNNRDVWWWQKKEKSRMLDEIGRNIDIANQNLADINEQTLQAYADLDAEVKALSNDLSAQGEAALTDIESQEKLLFEDIIKNEVTGLVVNAYRTILGRDPDQPEIDTYLSLTDLDNQKIDGQALIDELKASEEYVNTLRTNENIKNEVISKLHTYLEFSLEQQTEFMGSLGLTEADIVVLNEDEIDYIIQYLKRQGNHFGQSAFNSLKLFLESHGANDINYEKLAIKAILIDILTGVLNATTGGDLQLSMFAMAKIAETEGIEAFYVKIDLSALKKMLLAGPAICHIDGKHYVAVERIEDGTVYYTETNRGRSGTTESLSEEEFNKVWRGYSITHYAPQDLSKLLSAEEARSICGSFFFLISWIIGALVVAITSLVTVIVTSVATIVSTIATAISGVIAGIASMVVGIGSSVIMGIEGVLAGLGTIGTGIGAFGAPLLKTAVGVGLSFGVSSGLQALGVNPTIGSLTTSFLTGGVMAILNPVSGLGPFLNFMMGALRGLTFEGLSHLGSNFGLSSAITNLIALTGSSIVGGAFEFYDDLGNLVTEVSQNVASEAAYIAVQEIGELVGIDPNISYLAGIGIRSSLQAGMHSFSSGGIPGEWAKELFDGAINGLVTGATNIGIQWTTQELGIPPLLASLGTAAITGAIEGLLEKQGFFKGIFDSYKSAAINLLTFGGPGSTSWEKASYVAQILDFSRIAQEEGFGKAFEVYATGMFHQQTINNIWKVGGIYDLLTNQDRVEITIDYKGDTVKRIYTNEKKTDYIDLALDDDRLMGKKEGNVIFHCGYERDKTGQWVLKNGETIVLKVDGSTETHFVENFNLVRIEMRNTTGNIIQVITKNSYKKAIEFSKDGLPTNCIISDPNRNIEITMKDGEIDAVVTGVGFELTQEEENHLISQGYSIDDLDDVKLVIQRLGNDYEISIGIQPVINPDGSIRFIGEDYDVLDVEFRNKLRDKIKYVVSYLNVSGIGSSDLAENDLPDYIDVHYRNLQSQILSEEGLTEDEQFFLGIFEGRNKADDLLQIILNKKIDHLSWELRDKLNGEYLSGALNFGDPIIPEFYSGSFEAGLRMLELMHDNAPIVVAVGGYSEKDTIDNAHVQYVLNLYGSEDWFVTEFKRGFGKKSFVGIETINIKIDGIGHDYYEYTEIASFIVRAKVKLSKSRTEFDNFINQYKISEADGEITVRIPQ